MAIVIDSSIATSWGLPGENSPAAGRALSIAETEEILVPALFWQEVRNVFLTSERRRRVTEAQTSAGLRLVANMPMRQDGGGSDFDVLGYARRHALSAYDACYLELAIRADATFATLDKRLARAALTENLTVVCDLS